VTISAAVVISTVNALTLSPALCATLLRPPGDRRRGPLAYFARALDASRDRYARIVAWLVRRLRVAFVVVALSIAGTYALFVAIPTTLLPQEDQGAVFVDVQLPEAASLERTEEVMAQVREILAATAGVEDVVAVSGFSILSGTLLANTGLVLAVLEPWEERTAPEEQLDALLARLRGELAAIPMAEAAAFAPPAIPGVGSVSGFDFRLQALEGQSPEELAAALRSLIVAANQEPAIAAAFSTFSADVPQVFVDLDPPRRRRSVFRSPRSTAPCRRSSARSTSTTSIYTTGFTRSASRPTGPIATTSRTSTGCTRAAPRARWCRCAR
jgi:HAE1 family hydrophobic/amphiphilic exporter-1/multidrug efflux pump